MATDPRAHRAVQHAITAGALPTPEEVPCADCTRPARIYHHHRGYAPEHWLDVVALCGSCHRGRHGAVPRRPGPKGLYVSIRFSPELLNAVRELAEEEHRSVNGTVLEAVERYVRQRRGRQPKEPGDAR